MTARTMSELLDDILSRLISVERRLTRKQRFEAENQANPGGAISGIDSADAVMVPGGFIMKTGKLTVGTTVSFGNEYFPVIDFTTPFPTKCLHVSVIPLWGNPITKASGNQIVVDILTVGNFRAFIPDSPNPWIRGIMWLAVGY